MPIEFYLTPVFIFIGSYKNILLIFFMLLVLKEKKRERERNGNEVLLNTSFQTCIDSQPS